MKKINALNAFSDIWVYCGLPFELEAVHLKPVDLTHFTKLLTP